MAVSERMRSERRVVVSEKRIAAQEWERAWWRVSLRWRRLRQSAREVGVGRVRRRSWIVLIARESRRMRATS